MSGPGITTDEVINVAQGVYLNDQILTHGPGLWVPETTRKVFETEEFLPDHPPLGRAVLGFCEMAFSSVWGSSMNGPYNIPAARCASCLMFAATVSLLFVVVNRRYDFATGILAAALLMVMPRFVAHGRLASLEAATSLTWLLTLAIPFCRWTEESDSKSAPPFRSMVLAGICWGFLLLTKMQGLLIMPVMGLWALRQFGRRFAVPLVVAGFTGATVFLIGWPWLLLDPWAHLQEYFQRAAARAPLQVMYFGHRFEDVSVPFHYSFVMTLITVPLVVLLGLVLRFVQRKLDRAEQLALLSVLVPLIVFALPGTAVYDGVRLFLMVMPMIAFLAARGILILATKLPAIGRWSVVVTSGALMLLPLPAVFSPYALVSYGIQVDGTSGAAALGMETDYWGVGLNDAAWTQIPEGSRVMVAPISHQFQLRDLQLLHPEVRKRNLKLISYFYRADEKDLLLVIHRRADLRPALATLPEGATLVGQVTYGKTPLVSIYDLENVTWTEVPDWPKQK